MANEGILNQLLYSDSTNYEEGYTKTTVPEDKLTILLLSLTNRRHLKKMVYKRAMQKGFISQHQFLQ